MRLALFVLALVGCPLTAQLAIEHVTVIDPRSGSLLPDHTVEIEGTTIRRVRPAAAANPERRYRRVDGRGRFLIPGLWDTHVHLTKAGETSLALFLANGVTSVRDMGSDPDEVQQWRKEIQSGHRPGPRIRTSGPILESKANVLRMKAEGAVEPVDRVRLGLQTPEEARDAVERLARIPVDHIKTRTVASADVLDAIVATARKLGLPMTGHPYGDPGATIGRFRSLEHAPHFPPLDDWTQAQRQTLFHRMRDEGTWMSTTMVNLEGSILVPYERALALISDNGSLDPRRRYLGGLLLADWREQVAESKGASAESLRKQVASIFRDLREVRDAGVKFLAGTDVGVLLMYPGFTLHDELRLYVEKLGFSSMETLRIATHNPAEFYGIESQQGAIAEGQAADLILLEANPLEDIGNTRRIAAVIAKESSGQEQT